MLETFVLYSLILCDFVILPYITNKTKQIIQEKQEGNKYKVKKRIYAFFKHLRKD